MKIATVPSKRKKELITIGILLLGLPLVIFASYQAYQFVTKASAEAQPRNVLLSNLTTTSVTVSWVTDIKSSSSVVPVVGNSEKSPVIDFRGTGKRYTHYVELKNLDPNSEYQFIIVSDGKRYTNEGSKNFVFRTAPITADTPTPNPIHGSVKGGANEDSIVYAVLKDKSTYPVSAVVPTQGNWIIDLSILRKVSDKSLVLVSGTTRLVIVVVSGVNKGSVIEGTYSELFDSSGKLKDVYSLILVENTTLYTHFPAASMLEVYSAPVITPVTPTTPSSPSTDEEDEEEEEEAGTFSRTFRIIHQLEWIDMVTGEGTASGDTGAESVQITNVTDNSFTVVWVSQNKEEGYIKYGTSKDSLSLTGSDERDGLMSKGLYFVHSVSVSTLQAATDYFFEVISGTNTYNNDGNKYIVKTFPRLTSSPSFDTASGVVDGMPEHKEGVIVSYIKDEDGLGSQGQSNKISTLIDENGKWVLSIMNSRVSDGSSYFEYTPEDSLYLSVVTTFPTSSQTKKISDIAQDIDLSLGVGSGVGVGYTKVELLGNYGILGYNSGRNVALEINDSSGTTYSVDSGSETPKTGILDNFIYLTLLSLSLLFSGVMIYRKSMTKSEGKGRMVRSL
jgi:hypothetical protein